MLIRRWAAKLKKISKVCSVFHSNFLTNYIKIFLTLLFLFLFSLQKIIMEGDGSPLSSLCMVRAAELFPRPEPEKEDDSLKTSFTECNLAL